MSTVEIVLKEGPVVIPSLAGLGLNRTIPLWSDISASEFFPPNVHSAFYILSLRKPVVDVDEVHVIERGLLSALRLLAMAWPFSGGSFMVFDVREIVVSDRFQSNAECVRAELLAAKGKKVVSSSVTLPYEVVGTYDRAPLEVASVVAKAARGNHGVRKLLEYYHQAWEGYYCRQPSDRSSWFIDLYKVRDLLKKLYGSEKAAIAGLSIPKGDWKIFGTILNNNDLRHAEITGIVPPVSQGDVDALYRLARTWTLSHLKAVGLPIP